MSRWAGSPALLYLGKPRVSVPWGSPNNNWVPTCCGLVRFDPRAKRVKGEFTMLSLTQTLRLAGAATLVALAAATIPALAPIGPQERILFDMSRQIGECQTARLAISRRACPARLGQVHIDTAENR
jgi:hypothetical protein